MTGPLKAAAPSRLRKAAGAGAQRCAVAYLRHARERTQVLADWARAGRQCRWVAGKTTLRKGPLFGKGLDRVCGAAEGGQDRETKPRPARKPLPKARKVSTRPRKARDLKPRALPPTPPAETSKTAKVMPPRATPGQLRLWSGADPEPREHDKPVRMPLAFKPADARPIPGSAYAPPSAWSEKLAGRAAARLSDRPGDGAAPPLLSAALAQPPLGTTVSHDLLLSAIGRTRTEHPAAPKRTNRHTPQGSAAPAQPTGKPQTAAPDQAARPAPRHMPASAHAAGKSDPAARPVSLPDPSRTTPDQPDVTGPATNDPLFRDTIGPPAHAPAAKLPPQPDLAQPFAEVLPLDSRTALSRPQGAVADEPPTDLPALPVAAPLPPRFDRDELSEALAEVLRDEARRHGIDV